MRLPYAPTPKLGADREVVCAAVVSPTCAMTKKQRLICFAAALLKAQRRVLSFPTVLGHILGHYDSHVAGVLSER